MSLVAILPTLLLLALIGIVPALGYGRTWGYGRLNRLGVVFVIAIVLLLGRF